MKNWTRKDFLKASLIGGGGALVAGHSRLYGQAPAVGRKGSASGDIRVAIVGINGQGNSHMKTYFKAPGARLVALCDVDSAVLDKRAGECAAEGITVKKYRDYRKLLEDREIDAVVLGTPNHWHSLQTIWGLQAGKDVYVEKPLSHNIWEGRQAVEAAKKYNKQLVQAGTQNRSSLDIPRAIEYIRSGKLGKLTHVRGLCYKRRASIGKTSAPQAVPATIDYDLWTGPADLVPPHRNGSRGPVHYDWHWFWNYGGGDISNQGIHQMDVARWILGEDGMPATVMSFGGRFGPQDDAETPNTEISVFGYKSAPLIFEVRGLPMKSGLEAMDAYRGTRVGVVAHCEGGFVTVSDSGTCVVYDKDNKKITAFADQGLGEHRANFIASLQARDPRMLKGKIENAHISTNLCHLGNISYLLGREKPNSEVGKAIRSNALARESFDRVMDHLRANSVDVMKTPTIIGPTLHFDGEKEVFVGPDRTLADAANKNVLTKRAGRGAFAIPEFKRHHVAST